MLIDCILLSNHLHQSQYNVNDNKSSANTSTMKSNEKVTISCHGFAAIDLGHTWQLKLRLKQVG